MSYLSANTSGGGGGGGTVTSVAFTAPTGFSVAGSPIVGAGTIMLTTALNGILYGDGLGAFVAIPDGTVGQQLTTNGAGVYSWATGTGAAGCFSTGSTLMTQVFGLNTFFDLDGLTITTTESEVQSALPAGNMSFVSLRVDANTLDASTTFTLRVNGVDTLTQMTVGAGAVGTFTSAVSTLINNLDLVNWRLNTTSSTIGQIDFHSVIAGGFGSNSSSGVTSVAMTTPTSLLTVAGSPINSTGTLALSLANVTTGWSATNGTGDKVFNATSTTLNEVADVLASLINQLKNQGLISS